MYYRKPQSDTTVKPLLDLYAKLKDFRERAGLIGTPELFQSVIKDHYKGGLANPGNYFEPTLAKLVAQTKDRLVYVDGENGPVIDVENLIGSHVFKDPEMVALYYTFMHPARGDIVKEQTKNAEYCSLVPVIPAAFKRYANIPYSKWDPSTFDSVVPTPLWEALDVEELEDFSIEEIQDMRDDALMNKSTGKTRPAISTYSLWPSKGSKLLGLPTLLRIMICQTWCAHPSVRNKYMILDPFNWDKMPESTYSTEVLNTKNPFSTLAWPTI